MHVGSVKVETTLVDAFQMAREKTRIKVRQLKKIRMKKLLVLMSMVCSPIAKQEIDFSGEKFDHLKDLTLADSNKGYAEVDIVSADFYYDFFTTG